MFHQLLPHPAPVVRYIKSGVGRARGPNDDEKSGIDFTIRTIGRHTNKKTTAKAHDSDSEATGSDVEDLGSVGSMGSLAFATPMKTKSKDTDADLLADPLTMSAKQLKDIAGDVAEDLNCAYFQHTARVTSPALFRPMSTMLNITTEKGDTKLFRKGQVDPSVFVRAFQSALSTSSVPLSSSDVFFNITGGTGEPLVAAVALGYRTLFHVAANSEEELMYALPSEEQERLNKVDYFNYRSPEPDIPSMGVLAAEAVRQITAYLKNEVLGVPSSIKVPLTGPLELKPVVVYTYMPVLNQIVRRTVREEDGKPAVEDGKKGSTQGKGSTESTDKKEAPVAPTVRGKFVTTKDDKQKPTKQDEEAEEEDHEQDEDKEEPNPDADLAALAEMQRATKRKGGATNSNGSKKPKKAS